MSAEKDIPQETSQHKDYPTQCAACPDTKLRVTPDHHESNSCPEDNLHSIEDEVSLEAAPAMEADRVLGEDLVGQDNEGLGTLKINMLDLRDRVSENKLTMPRPIVVERPGGRLGKMSRTPERVMTVMIKVTKTICRGSLLRRVKKGSIFLRNTGVILIDFVKVVKKKRR